MAHLFRGIRRLLLAAALALALASLAGTALPAPAAHAAGPPPACGNSGDTG